MRDGRMMVGQSPYIAKQRAESVRPHYAASPMDQRESVLKNLLAGNGGYYVPERSIQQQPGARVSGPPDKSGKPYSSTKRMAEIDEDSVVANKHPRLECL